LLKSQEFASEKGVIGTKIKESDHAKVIFSFVAASDSYVWLNLTTAATK